MIDDETPVAWTVMPRHLPVMAAGGSQLGTTESVLGDRNDDIFHGLVVRRGADGELVELPAARVKKITRGRVETDLGESEASSLSPYRGRL